MLEMLKMDLQLFADEDLEEDEVLLESGGYVGEPEEDEDDFESESEEDEDLEDEELDDNEEIDEDDPALDKKTKSIIKHRKENKELRRQLKEIQEKVEADQLERETSDRIAELTKDGKSKEEATKIANDEKEVKQLRLQLAQHEINALESKYPGISIYSKRLADDKARLPEFTYEQLYLAKYAKSNAYDEKTKIEQELVYKTKKAKSKSLEGSDAKQKQSIKLSKADERAFNHLKKSRPNLTKKQYLEILKTEM